MSLDFECDFLGGLLMPGWDEERLQAAFVGTERMRGNVLSSTSLDIKTTVLSAVFKKKSANNCRNADNKWRARVAEPPSSSQ